MDDSQLTGREQLVYKYFEEGLTYKEILNCLATAHGLDFFQFELWKELLNVLNSEERLLLHSS